MLLEKESHQMPLLSSTSIVTGVTESGGLRRADLIEARNLPKVLNDIHNHLAANASNMTRSETLSKQLIILLFCKLYDELNIDAGEILFFQIHADDAPEHLSKRFRLFFDEHVKPNYSDVFDSQDQIALDANNLAYVVNKLQVYQLASANRDVIGSAFEAIIGSTLKGSKGQFFTPRNAVKMIVDIVDPQPGERILDPACGSGGFLVVAHQHIASFDSRRKVETDFVGIDKDRYLAQVANTYLRLLGANNISVFNENSLAHPSDWHKQTREKLEFGSFDIILTNPPFGDKLKVVDEKSLKQFDLSRKWALDPISKRYAKTVKVTPTSPQILFIERCIELLREGGRLGIVLPESLLGNPSYGYIMQYLQDTTQLNAVISMPEDLFQPYTHAKSCVVIAQKILSVARKKFFMGIVEMCGHDSRGNPTTRHDKETGETLLLDDIPVVTQHYKDLMLGDCNGHESRLGFSIGHDEISGNVFIPKYYDPAIKEILKNLEETHDLVTVGSLLKQKALSIKTGVEVGRLAYGTGSIPFIRTSDITNWELKIDPKHGVSEEIYEEYKKQAEVRTGDILLVRDGTYLVGTSCILTKYDTKILFQSHMYRIRVLRPEVIDPFLLFAIFNSPIVKKQIRAKQFTQHVIDTLGSRINELVLPITKVAEERNHLAQRTRKIVETRAKLRQDARDVARAVEGYIESFEGDIDVM